MRSAPLTARLLLVAHGSKHPDYADMIVSIAMRVAELRPGLPIAGGYLEHCEPRVSEVAAPGDIVVPLLLSRGFHASSDIAQQAPGAVVAPPLGPSPLLAQAAADRLREAGWAQETPVVLAAAGSSDPAGLVDVEIAAELLAVALGVDVTPAYLSSGTPTLSQVLPAAAICTYLLAPGHFATQAAECGAAVISSVLGNHPAIARLILDRYDAAAHEPAP